MTKMMTLARDLKSDDSGAAMVEYGLLAGLIAVALIVTIGLMSDALDGIFVAVQTALEDAVPDAGTPD